MSRFLEVDGLSASISTVDTKNRAKLLVVAWVVCCAVPGEHSPTSSAFSFSPVLPPRGVSLFPFSFVLGYTSPSSVVRLSTTTILHGTATHTRP